MEGGRDVEEVVVGGVVVGEGEEVGGAGYDYFGREKGGAV